MKSDRRVTKISMKTVVYKKERTKGHGKRQQYGKEKRN